MVNVAVGSQPLTRVVGVDGIVAAGFDAAPDFADFVGDVIRGLDDELPLSGIVGRVT